MVFVYIILFATLVYTYMVFETTWLKVEKLDLSKDSSGLRIMHITDLHIYMTRISAARVRKVVKAEDPDVILITGDYINRASHAPAFLKYLHIVCNGYRTIICLGNHDYRAFGSNKAGLEDFVHEIESQQVEVLRNSTVLVEKDGKKYNIIGIDDLRRGRPDIGKAMQGCITSAPKICITHNPDLVLSMQNKAVDYVFAGHFHGGQIWMPFNLEFVLLRDDQLCRMGLKRGMRRINDINVYINRGLGNGVVPLRLLSRPEILICTIP